jgi:hypothetical protein
MVLEEPKDWRKEWNETLFNIFRSLKFVTSILLESGTAAVIVFSIKLIQLIITPELRFFGFEIHQIALIFEEAVLVGFFVSSLIKHFKHLFEDEIAWVLAKMRG